MAESNPETTFTPEPFDSLKNSVSNITLKVVKEMGFTMMTQIQSRAIPDLLEGKDVRGTAKTGSGKTLAFLIPVIELLKTKKFTASKGTGAIIVSPTRELAMQTYKMLNKLADEHKCLSYGLVMGGKNKKTEAINLSSGINIVVATPGRLLDHLLHTDFRTKHCCCLVIDEADRILEAGFEKEIKQIVQLLPKKRQTMMFSATKCKKTNDLALLSLKTSDLIEIDVDSDKIEATVEGLDQEYCVVPFEKKFRFLYTFIKKKIKKKKAMVFFSSCNAVKFYDELFNHIGLPVMSIQGLQKQSRRTNNFNEFNECKAGILLCTDVAARGWDVPNVDWVLQFDPPDNPREYIHRVGRTARAGLVGKAQLLLAEDQLGFIGHLTRHKITVHQSVVQWDKMAKENVQTQLEDLITTEVLLGYSAKAAFKSFVKAYVAYSLKNVFDVHDLDLKQVAKCFGFTVPPVFDISSISLRKRKRGNENYMKKKRLK